MKPTLTTPRLILRPPLLSDLEGSVALWSHPLVKRYSGGPAPREAIVEGFHEDLKWSSQDFGFFTVVETSSHRHIGDAGLIQKTIEGEREIELVYFFHPLGWGRGLATEAAIALRDHGMKSLGLTRLVALIHPDNLPSKRVAEKAGFGWEKSVVTKSGNERQLWVHTA